MGLRSQALISVLDEAGIPTKVEKVDIIPPSGQVGPISDLERRKLMDASPMRVKYSAEPEEARAIHAFTNRMRKASGIPEQPFRGGWTEGDYRKFLPDWEKEPAAPARGRKSFAISLLIWSAFTAACAAVAGAILA
jgi:hypothetical protein